MPCTAENVTQFTLPEVDTHPAWMALPYTTKLAYLAAHSAEAPGRDAAEARMRQMIRSVPMVDMLGFINVSKATYYGWLVTRDKANHRYPSLLQFWRMCAYTGYTLDWVLSGMGVKYVFEIPGTVARSTQYADLVNQGPVIAATRQALVDALAAIDSIPVRQKD